MRLIWLGVFSFFCCFSFSDLTFNRKYEAYFERAEQSYKQEKFSETFALLYVILKDPGSLTRTPAGILYTEDIIQDFLANISSDARKFYEQEYEPKAKLLLKETEKKIELEKLKTLYSLYRNTPSGYEGANIYASYYLDIGKSDYAAFLFEKLSRAKWTPPEKRLVILTKWVLALIYSGQKQKADELILEIEKEYAPTDIKFNTKKSIAWKTLKNGMFSKEIQKRDLSPELLAHRLEQLEIIKLSEAADAKEQLKQQFKVLKLETKDPAINTFIENNFTELYCEQLPPEFQPHNTLFNNNGANYTDAYIDPKGDPKDVSLRVLQYNFKDKKLTSQNIKDVMQNDSTVFYRGPHYCVFQNYNVSTENNNPKTTESFFILNYTTKEKKELYKQEYFFNKGAPRTFRIANHFIYAIRTEQRPYKQILEDIYFVDLNGNLKPLEKNLYDLFSSEILYTSLGNSVFSDNHRYVFLNKNAKIVNLETQKVVPADFSDINPQFPKTLLQLSDSGDSYIYHVTNTVDKKAEIYKYENKKHKKIFESKTAFSVYYTMSFNKNVFAAHSREGRTGSYTLYSYDPIKNEETKIIKLVGALNSVQFSRDGEYLLFFNGNKGYYCNVNF